MKNSLKFWLKVVLIVIVFGFIYSYVYKYVYKEVRKITEPTTFEPYIKPPTMEVNFLGTDKPQQVYIEYTDTETKIQVKNNGKLMAEETYPENMLNKSAKAEIIKLSNKSNKEYIVWTSSVGPHEFEVIVMSANQEQLAILYAADLEKETWYAPFWVSRGNKALIKDINGDGFKEIVEFVDELPINAPRLNNPEVEKITKEVFSEKEISKEKSEQTLEIVKRENNGLGRGFRVAWNIYSFVDVEEPYFKKLNKQEYETMVKILLKDSPAYQGKTKFTLEQEGILFTPDPEIDLSDTISRSQLSRNSIEFNEFVRKFWAGGYYNEPFGEHMPEIE